MSSLFAELARLARTPAQESGPALDRLLQLASELLDLDLACLATLDGDDSVLRRVFPADDAHLAALVGERVPTSESWLGTVLERDGMLVPDVARDRRLRDLRLTRELAARSGAGVVLRGADGEAVGALLAVGRRTQPTLNDRDLAVLAGLGQAAVPLVAELDLPHVPAPRRAPDLERVAEMLSSAEDLESLTRPLLDALHDLTGLASTYLTSVDEVACEQRVVYSRNTVAGFVIPEGIVLPWEDTLCKRALDEGRPCTSDVPGVWGDSGPAAALGIQTYVSVPVRSASGALWGTLCAADSGSRPDAADHLPTLALFARLVGAEVTRQAAVDAARREAETDALTGCGTRRLVAPYVAAALRDLPASEVVALVYVDVDDFKTVNDSLGHAVGDDVLAEVGARLRLAAPRGGLVVRLGGDEFLVASRVPREDVGAAARRLADMVAEVRVRDVVVRCSTGLATSDDTDEPLTLLGLADAAMYADKAGSLRG